MAGSGSANRVVKITLTWIVVSVGTGALVCAIVGSAAFAYDRLYQGKMFPGVRIAGVRLDGLTKEEAQKEVQSTIDRSLRDGFRFVYQDHEITIDATTVSTDPDASRELIRYSIDRSLNEAFEAGRQGTWFHRFLKQTQIRVAPVFLNPDVTFDRQRIRESIEVALRPYVTLAQNAKFQIEKTGSWSRAVVVPERTGVSLNLDPALDELQAQARAVSFHSIVLHDVPVTAGLVAADLEPLRENANAFLARKAPVFLFGKTKFETPHSSIDDWLSVTGTTGELSLEIHPQTFRRTIKELAGTVEKEAKNGSLVVKDGKVESFVAGTEGIEIDMEKLYADVSMHWPASSTFPLIVKRTFGTLIGEDPDELGIKELLGVGTSNFSGSPANRRKNIALGIKRVDGSIIKDQETFSLLKTLGSVDQEHGWLPELVIKGNETKPEFGGGLCQIGTTTFRGTMAAGLPVIERQNHSYRVRYYEPAGTDATIYEPRPDYRFLNDTGHSILIHAYKEDDDISFEFWGTKDGRSAEQTKPQIWNIVEPPPMKLVETLDLAPGKKKCTETAHAGADAAFTYTVTYPNGEMKKQTFTSHYRPWQAVCLVGVEKLTASSTPAELSSPDSAAP